MRSSQEIAVAAARAVEKVRLGGNVYVAAMEAYGVKYPMTAKQEERVHEMAAFLERLLLSP
jgi:hypothetical protein